MRIAELTLQRPVLAMVLSILITLVGAMAFWQLQVREYPRIDEPVVTVNTRLTGASAEVMESQVTKPLEDAVSGIDGVDMVTSISRAEQSQISVRFKLSKPPESAAADVRDRIGRVRGRLPDTADEPVVTKVEADASPTLWLAFSSDAASALELTDMVQRLVKPRVQTVPGVADVSMPGERRAAMRIGLDAQRLAAYQLTVQDVEDALRQQNLEVPAGRVENLQREFTVSAKTDLQTPAAFRAVVLKSGPGWTVSLGEVARVEVDAASERNAVRFNGRDAVGLGLIRQATANPLDLARDVRAMLPQLAAELPPGVQVAIANDLSVFIDRSVGAVYRTIAEATGLVVLVVWIFLRTLRASLIPVITIPVSLVGTFALMALAGFTLNTLTLLALVLAIGLVVDDAIVVLENIHRHIEEGLSPLQAAFKGVREIGFAVVAMTLTLAAVFAPLAFTPGRTGRLFAEFALSLAGAVIVSGFVALTLSPMMCSRLLRHQPSAGRWSQAVESVLDGLTRLYARCLTWALSARWVVMIVMLACAGLSVAMYRHLPSELSPMEDRGVVVVSVNAPDGSTLPWTQRYLNQIDKMAAATPEVDRRFVIAGNPSVSQGLAVLVTTDWAQRLRSTSQLAQSWLPTLQDLPGVSAFASTPPSLGQGFRERPLNVVITAASAEYGDMLGVAQRLMRVLAEQPGIVQPDLDLRMNKPELSVAVDRERAADAGVSVDQIAHSLETLLGGRAVTRFKRNADQYDVIVQAQAAQRLTPEDIGRLWVRASGGQMLPLSSFVRVTEGFSPRELNHFNQQRAVTLTANLAPGYALGSALEAVDAAAKQILPQGYALELNGISREYKASAGALGVVFVLALLFIYLVLAAQFESFVDPWVILLSVPLSMAGALATLGLQGGTLNVYSQIGLITLVGLITKHGILIVEFANQLRAQGLDKVAAVRQSACLRLRPILMTTAAMVFGAVPLALATGVGAESRQQIGWVIVGGMSVGTALTLIVVPTMYTLLTIRRYPSQAQGGAAGEAAHTVA